MTQMRTLVKWDDSYSLELPEIDAQHRTLLELINSLWQAIVTQTSAEHLLPHVEALDRYTLTHFAEEEQFMLASGYPRLEEHRAAHRSFEQRIAGEKAIVLDGGFVRLDLVRFLNDWLINHILVVDKDYAQYVKQGERPSSFLGRFFRKFA